MGFFSHGFLSSYGSCLGSFVRPANKEALEAKFDPRVDISFGISDDAIVHLHGKGGRTVLGLRSDLDVVSSLAPDVVILDIGTNDHASRSW